MNAVTEFPTQQVLKRLQRWKPKIERALRDSDLLTYADIESDVLESRKLFFDTETAFAVVDVQDYTRGRVCHILVAGGTLKGLRELQERALPFFRAIGARRLTQAGRHGFMKTLPAWGWTRSLTLMELEL